MKALVTGASSGIGRDIAKVLDKKGYEVVLVARNEEKLKKVAKELKKAEIIVTDLSIEENCKKVLEKVGAAKIILDKELNFTKLNNTINNIVKDTETLKTMGESAKRVARADVEENIYKEICRIVSKHETRNNLPPE